MGRRTAKELFSLSKEEIQALPKEEFKQLLGQVVDLRNEQRQLNALAYYTPGNTGSLAVHQSQARVVGLGGGNGASKTETVLAELAMRITGICPDSLKGKIDFDKKFRGPINTRVICQSLTTVLHPIMLKKLQWFTWTGIDMPGGKRGHYGWIPRHCLIDGSWEKSWSEKLRMLNVHCFDPENPKKKLGMSSVQFMSHEQDAADFASGDFHFVIFDEPPKHAIYVENEARTMRVNGQMYLAMTWPDDPAINVDWLFDKVYEKAQPGPEKDPDYDWFNLFTTDNEHLDQAAIAAQAGQWSEEIRNVRIYGKPIRFSNRIHPLFTDQTEWWCYDCMKQILPNDGKCRCGSTHISTYSHVEEFEGIFGAPCVFLLDPHPRKPHMFMWVQIDGNDDWWVTNYGECDGSVLETKEIVDDIEQEYRLRTALRLIDPNMGRSPAASSRARGVTWQDEFDGVGLRCDLADDSSVGIQGVNEYLTPDVDTHRPRITFHPRCTQPIFQMKRFMWDDHKRSLEKDQKQRPKPLYDDYPTLLKYLRNWEPTSDSLLYTPTRHATSRHISQSSSAPWAQQRR